VVVERKEIVVERKEIVVERKEIFVVETRVRSAAARVAIEIVLSAATLLWAFWPAPSWMAWWRSRPEFGSLISPRKEPHRRINHHPSAHQLGERFRASE
jgi:hypothetical protein